MTLAALGTPRLHLRPFTLADGPFILRLLNEPSFHEHIGDKGVRDLDGARAYLESGPMASYARHGHGLLAVALKTTGEPIGMCGLLKRDNLDHPDLGYAFLPEFGSKGYALEAAAATLEDTVAALGYSTLLAIVSPGNTASINLLGKLGFSFEKLATLHPGEPAVAVYAWEKGT